MAQVTQLDTARNKEISADDDHSGKRRDYFFTWNNYTPENIAQLTQLKCKYIFQEELGEEKKTPHLQGYFKFENARSKNSLRKILKGIYLMEPKNEFACKTYCQKIETRNGKVYCNVPSWSKLSDENLEKPKLKKHYTKEDLEKWGKEDLESWIKDIDLSDLGLTNTMTSESGRPRRL